MAQLPQSMTRSAHLFLGNGSYTVAASGDLLLGPVVNPFLLPEGYNNTFWFKTYVSTYGLGDANSLPPPPPISVSGSSLRPGREASRNSVQNDGRFFRFAPR